MDILNALQAPRRREILRTIWNAERSAGEIRASQPGVTFGAVSQHLRVLERAGLVSKRNEGTYHYYVARKESLGPLRQWLEQMWDDALYRLKIQAELEEARRGPKSQQRRRQK